MPACKNPYMTGPGRTVPGSCGKCMSCRVNKKRLWTHRLLLEASCSKEKCFVTLTYDDANLPDDLSVDVAHGQLFLKRLRYFLKGRKIRYFLVGEYGEKTQRPHYHLLLFNVSKGDEEAISKSWSAGFVHVGEVNKDSIQYCCQYTTKKMTSKDDPRLKVVAQNFRLSPDLPQ